MKALVLSDLHPDMWFSYAVKSSRIRGEDPKEDVVMETLDWMWKYQDLPSTPAIMIAGDLANDYLTFTREIKWLSNKYEQVYFTLGNHDLIVRGATASKSNLQFNTSEEKLSKMKEYCAGFPNVHLLEGNVVNGVGGTMLTCDLKCEALPYINYNMKWKREWFDGRHWKYFNNNPSLIWNHYEEKLNNIIAQKPNVVMTHFAPYEVGVSFEFRNSPHNVFFFYNGMPFFNKLTQDTTWICGHIHDRKICEIENDSGKKIKILCNPYGYPGEGNPYADCTSIKDEKIVRESLKTTHDDFIIDI